MAFIGEDMRINSDKIDAILEKKIEVLDDGFVRPVDYMGNDSSIIQAARVSYGDGTKKSSDDRSLIRYLMRNEHWTPFEMCEVKFHVRVPMDIWRQWIRHRTASVNEYSTRYSVAIDSMSQTSPLEWRKQALNNKQGSDGFIEKEAGSILTLEEKEIQQKCQETYKKRLSLGVAREQARKDLPLSTYTEAYWKIDLRNLFNFLRLRLDTKAQYEIREYANAMAYVVSEWVPLAWEAFYDYMFNTVHLSQQETKLICYMNNHEDQNWFSIFPFLG
jgi:thymidylate synthase (FAD)